MTKSSKQTRAAVAPDEKLEPQDFDLFKALDAIDRKDYDWYSSLTEEQQKKFVPYMMLHWASAVTGRADVQRYVLSSTEYHANKHYFNQHVQQHPHLQWLLLCASSPGIGKQFHKWIPHLSNKFTTLREAVKSKEARDYFEKIYKGQDSGLIRELADSYTQEQNHKARLSALFPQMKLADIEMLATITTDKDIEQYERELGN